MHSAESKDNSVFGINWREENHFGSWVFVTKALVHHIGGKFEQAWGVSDLYFGAIPTRRTTVYEVKNRHREDVMRLHCTFGFYHWNIIYKATSPFALHNIIKLMMT